MFICLEVDTEDTVLWTNIDNILAQELGFVHVVWGIRTRDGNKSPISCTLPSNVYYGNCNETCPKMKEAVVAIVLRYTEVGYKLIVIDETKTWSHDSKKSKPATNNMPTGGVEEVEGRQE